MIGSALTARRARIEPLLASARSIADGASERGKRARERLTAATGLSAEGVDFALGRCLECQPSEAELAVMIRSTPEAARAHVLLSANVFVAAHRAIAIALAAAEVVHVRASRREPQMAELLWDGAPDSFRLLTELAPQAGDQLWAYGSDEALQNVARRLPEGVVVHAHGTGFGVGVIAGRPSDAHLDELLRRLAEDVALFDQRGCLSPRLLLVTAGSEFAIEAARELALRLEAIEARIPRGRLDPQEAAQVTAYRDAASYAGEVFQAGLGFVSAGGGPAFQLPPAGRNLHVLSSADVLSSLSNLSALVTTCAITGDAPLLTDLQRALPRARFCNFGEMQTPPFDGAVDRRLVHRL